ncbi:hypothetical protein AB0H43_02940 [Hamadaea sp. NPDC050747]|uniref:hypothetical protein n=1 Tax=Hamadaea sp. NPDC050747 TaxID=3155789 RepID=UPI0033F4FA27
MSPLDDAARAVAERHGLDPADFVRRVRAAADRRRARGSLPFKTCPACSRELPALAYAEDTSKGDGLKVTCRECDAARTARRRASPSAGA